MTKALVIVLRKQFRLKHYELSENGRYIITPFRIAVGKIGAETPAGGYTILNKTKKPDWRIPPNKDYPTDSWGKIIKWGEEGNPFAGAFISIGNGLGMHGTSFEPHLGEKASHGCIRMSTHDVLWLYERVSVGTPVVIV